ncbi:hypothetical protein DPMN_103862 [Dreissena polymorpha]|uniref:Uncharacterized protein n=1 Tax=Dreissena polymorpha TaxID=45954 RepID=A0A9D4K2I5_DREPO|nr:hypothetical protein DPMN_103862 [Dreissena polymorpha]
MSTGFVSSKNFVGGVVRSSFIPEDIGSSPFSVDFSIDVDESQASGDKLGSLLLSGNPSLSGPAWESGAVGNQTDEDKLVHLTCVDEAKPTTTNINTTAEYNAGYSGISILPWEDFVYNPRVLNDLFFTESNRKITYDPDEVNVFFHGKNVMPPTIGDISDNGKSW